MQASQIKCIWGSLLNRLVKPSVECTRQSIPGSWQNPVQTHPLVWTRTQETYSVKAPNSKNLQQKQRRTIRVPRRVWPRTDKTLWEFQISVPVNNFCGSRKIFSFWRGFSLSEVNRIYRIGKLSPVSHFPEADGLGHVTPRHKRGKTRRGRPTQLKRTRWYPSSQIMDAFPSFLTHFIQGLNVLQ